MKNSTEALSQNPEVLDFGPRHLNSYLPENKPSIAIKCLAVRLPIEACSWGKSRWNGHQTKRGLL
jgi:hypothetical protein